MGGGARVEIGRGWTVRAASARLALHILSWALLAPVAAFAQLPPPPIPPQNPITEPKRVLGKILFWEEQLSSDNTVSCGTCHQTFRASGESRPGVHPGLDQQFNTPDDVFGSRGVVRRDAGGAPVDDPLFGFESQVTRRSSQSVFNALWSPRVFWDGRAGPAFVDPQTLVTVIPFGGALEAQAIAPILSDDEMAMDGRTWTDVIDKLDAAVPMALATYLPPDMAAAVNANPTYPALFQAAFGDGAISAQRIAFAIASYERTLVPNQTNFDLGTLTPQQQQGLNTFQSPLARCAICHAGAFFTDQTFRNIGLRPIAEDTGRQEVTGNVADGGRFKVPGLRNVGLKRTFMHNGRRSSLEEVLDFYLEINGQVQFPANQDPLIGIINIPAASRPNLIEFLRNGLTDPRVAAESFPFDRPILASERGDVDRDGDVDAMDRGQFESCFTGENAGTIDLGCERLDMDGDFDIGCDDWAAFVGAWTEEGVPAELAACVQAPVPTVSEWGLAVIAMTLLTAGTIRLRGSPRSMSEPT